MSDPTFFGPPTPLAVAAIAKLTGATINDGADEKRSITGISSLDRAGPHDIAFIDSPRFASVLGTTRAGACFCSERYRSAVPAGTIALITAAASAIVPASGPILSSDDAKATNPYRLTRPYVGLSPLTPQNAAGVMIEPDVSEPMANGTSAAATAAPGPLEEPPDQ